MEKRIYDKKTGIHYELQGDYYLPCLELPEQPKVEIGIWGCGSPVETSAAGRSTDRADRRDLPLLSVRVNLHPAEQAGRMHPSGDN